MSTDDAQLVRDRIKRDRARERVRTLKRLQSIMDLLDRCANLDDYKQHAETLRREFETLRQQVLNPFGDWKKYYGFCKDLAKSQTDLAELLGVSERAVRNHERQLGIAPQKAGRKKGQFRISAPDSKPRKT